jgi:hypothetical protein
MATTYTLIAGLPPEHQLLANARIVFEAVDPTTGLAVTGVTISAAGIYADADDATLDQLGPYMLVPGPGA